MIDFTHYKMASKYAVQINAGYSASLQGKPKADNPETADEKRQAWDFGWDQRQQRKE